MAAFHPPLLVAPTPSDSVRLGSVKLVLAKSVMRSDSSSSLLIGEIKAVEEVGRTQVGILHPPSAAAPTDWWKGSRTSQSSPLSSFTPLSP